MHTLYVYGLCKPGSKLFYIGMTKNIESRLQQHSWKYGEFNLQIFLRTKDAIKAFNEERRLIQLFDNELVNIQYSISYFRKRWEMKRQRTLDGGLDRLPEFTLAKRTEDQ